MSARPAPIIIQIANPEAFSGQGSIIVVELLDADAARRLARNLSQETGRRVTVKDAEMKVIEIVPAPATH